MTDFQIGDIVWAKMSKYPLWPGVIITPVATIAAPYIKGSQHFVKFYGDETCSWIPDKNIKKHSQELIDEAKSGRKLQKAIRKLKEDLERERLILEKQKLEMQLQEKQAYKREKNRKRIRDQEQMEAKSNKPKVTGETNKERNKPQVVIEDLNVYKNPKEIEEDQHMQEDEAPKLHQNEEEFDKSSKIQEVVTEHPKMNESKKRKRDQEQVKAKSKKPKVSRETNKEIKNTHIVIEDPNVYKNQEEIADDQPMLEKEDDEVPKIHQNDDEFDKSHKIQDKVTEHPKVTENREEDKEEKTKKQCVNEVEMVQEQVLPIKDCVTEKDSTPPQQSIDDTLELILNSDEILLSEFWRNKSGKIQALKHLQKVIEVLKEEIQKEESLQKQKFEMQVQCVPEMKIIEHRVLSPVDCITEDSSPSEQSSAEILEPIIFSSEALSKEFWENVILDEEKQTEAFLKAHFKTSSENVSIIIPIRPKDIEKLQLITPQKGLNFIHKRLPETSIKPFELAIDWNSRSDFWEKFLPSSIKFGFMGNGFLKSRIVKNLLLSKQNVTLWDEATTGNREAEEAFNLHGAKRVKTFEEFIENCDIIFSYWENTRTVKSQMLRALCSVSKEVFAGKGYVELSTLDPETADQIGKAITCHGGRFLEVAVLGDMQDAEDGNLVVLASGDQGLFDECSLTFQAIAKYSYCYRGTIGRGSIMKIGHSMLQGTALSGLAEVVALIQSHGFKAGEFTDVLKLTPFQHNFWVNKAESMFEYNIIPSRPVDDQRRDFQFGLDLASSSKQPAWTCGAVNEMFKQVINYGYDEDIDAIRNVYETLEKKK